MKKLISLLLAGSMFFSLAFPVYAEGASVLGTVEEGETAPILDVEDEEADEAALAYENEVTASGSCGTGVTYILQDGTLTVSGHGAIEKTFAGLLPMNCGAVYKIVVEEGITAIGAGAFSAHSCYRLESVSSIKIPSTVKTIGRDAFSFTDITNMVIPEGVESIGGTVFGFCTRLKSVTIPSSVSYIEKDAFRNCTGLENIIVNGQNPYYMSEDGILFKKDKTELLCYPGGKGGSYTIPEGVFEIGDYAFSDCRGLRNLVMPDSLISIGRFAFDDCTGLTKINIPRTVEEVKDYFHGYCDVRRDVYYGGSEEEWYKAYLYTLPSSEKITMHFALDSENYFLIKRDNNNFHHVVSSFYSNEEIASKQVGKYQTAYLEQLLEQASQWERARITTEAQKKLAGEWKGSCLGITTSMVYLNRGKLRNIFGEETYYKLGMPVDNIKLRDVTNYFSLCQYLSDFEPDYKTYKLPIFNDGMDLKQFLRAIVAEASLSQLLKKPFVLQYTYKKNFFTTGGHAVVVCGCKYENEDKSYHLTIYDCNNQFEYLEMRIGKDFEQRDFEFIDGNGEKIHSCWKSMMFYSIDMLEQAEAISKIDAETGSENGLEEENSLQIDNQINLMIPAWEKVNIVNAEGQTLVCDGEDYYGTMQVYEVKTVIEPEAKMILTVDASDSFTVTDFENNVIISTEIDGRYFQSSVSNADTIQFSKTEGIVIDGENYTFSSAISSDLNSCPLMEISGKTSGKSALVATDDKIVLDSEQVCIDVEIETFGTEVSKTYTVDEEPKKIIIVDSKDDIFVPEIVIPEKDVPHTYIASFVWLDDFSACTATLTCADSDIEPIALDCKVTDEITKQPTAADPGEHTYTATVVYEDKTYTDTRIQTIPATGTTDSDPHIHTYVTDFAWSDDSATCTATLTCTDNDFGPIVLDCEVTDEITKQPTATDPGERTYTATVVYEDEIYTDTHIQTIPATGTTDPDPHTHTYVTDFAWSDDFTTCTVTLTCADDDMEPVVLDCEVTNEITKQPTATELGERTYTASVVYEDETYTDTHVETIPTTSANVSGGGSGGGDDGGAVVLLAGAGAAAAAIAAWKLIPVQVSGIATDPSGMVLANAAVALRKDGEIVQETVTDENGGYSLKVRRGEYQLTACWTDPVTGQTFQQAITIKAPNKECNIVIDMQKTGAEPQLG